MKKLNFGIIGCGRITDLHAPGYAGREDARIYAACDVKRENAERRAREWGAEKVYADYRDLLADPAVDAVEVITPHHLHSEICVAACRAGKHVSVQKPMALTVPECDTMIRAAREAGVKLKVFENFVFYPPYVKARELIRDGAIGEPLSIRIRLGGAGRGGWKVPFSAWLWRLNEQTCGGGPNIFDDGYHKFSIAIYFLGDIGGVNAWVDRSFGIIDAPALISWDYKNSARVGFLDSTMSPNMTVKSKYYAVDERVEITGTEGVIWVTRCTAQLLAAADPVPERAHGIVREPARGLAGLVHRLDASLHQMHSGGRRADADGGTRAAGASVRDSGAAQLARRPNSPAR